MKQLNDFASVMFDALVFMISLSPLYIAKLKHFQLWMHPVFFGCFLIFQFQEFSSEPEFLKILLIVIPQNITLYDEVHFQH